MSFLQLVLSLDKTKEEIILFWRICQFDRYRNISLSLKNVMFVMFVIAQLVLGGVFCGNQSNCRMHSNWRMLEWGGFPGDTGTL